MPVYGNQVQYAQRTDLANLGLIGGVLSSIPTATQDAALIAASGKADSKLQSRYIMPLQQWGQDLVEAVCAIAAYILMRGKGYNPATGADPNIRQGYLDALAWLDEVGKGNDSASYIIDSSTSGTTGTTGAVTSADGSVVMTTEGGMQMQTSNVRGWTRRGDDQDGGTTFTSEFWDGNWR